MRKLILLLICAAGLYASAPLYVDVPATSNNGWFTFSYERDGHGDGSGSGTSVTYNIPAYVSSSQTIVKVTLMTSGTYNSCSNSSWASADLAWPYGWNWAGGDVTGPPTYNALAYGQVTLTWHPVMYDVPYEEDPYGSCSGGASTSTLRVYYYNPPTFTSITGIPAHFARNVEYTVSVSYNDPAGGADMDVRNTLILDYFDSECYVTVGSLSTNGGSLYQPAGSYYLYFTPGAAQTLENAY